MLTYIIRRVVLMVPTLIGITLVVFFTMALSPGGVGASLLNVEGNLRPEERKLMEEYLNKRYGLNDPYVVQYIRWLNRVSPVGYSEVGGEGDEGFWSLGPVPLAVTWKDGGGKAGVGLKSPDLGESFNMRRRVTDVVAERLPATLLLNLITIPIIYLVAVTTGIYAGRYRAGWFDVGSGTVFLALWSLPIMWVGVMLIGFLASVDYLHWFPTNSLHSAESASQSFLPHRGAEGWELGWLLDTAYHLVLPVVCLTYGGFAFLSKLMRASVLENMSADFVRTARAKGVNERAVLFRHVLRNSVLPLITVAAGILPGLLGGSLIVEEIFSIRGMGTLMIDAIRTRDREIVLGTTLVIAIISMVSLLVADLCYAVADPRVSYE